MSKTFESELSALRSKYGLLVYSDCDEAETKELSELYKQNKTSIPNDICVTESLENDHMTYRFQHTANNEDISHQERVEYCLLKQIEHLQSIKSMVLFFVILTCIALVGSLLLFLPK